MKVKIIFLCVAKNATHMVYNGNRKGGTMSI